MSGRQRRAVMLMGPTASGKSSLAMKLAERLPVEIISVDSAQVYRGLDIGTAKPTIGERDRVPHHLIDIRDPADAYSAGEFRRDALRLIDDILARGRLPLLVGGTMLYFRALTQGLAELPVADDSLRRDIAAEAASIGWPAMHQRLAAIDADAASRIDVGDAQRIQRAIEVHALTGEKISVLQQETRRPADIDWLRFALWPDDREELNARIEMRFDRMISEGLVDEVRALHTRPDLHPELPAIRAVGYRQLWVCCDGKSDLDGAVAEAKTATRRLAKRQMTWLRAEKDLRRLGPLESRNAGPISRVIERWLENEGQRATLC